MAAFGLFANNVPHVVMLATPSDFEDYAYGFTLSESLVARPEEIHEVEVTQGAEAVDVKISVAWERFTELLHRRRNLTGRTGCGLCGSEKAEDAIRAVGPVGPGPKVSVADLHGAIEQLGTLQPINARTGSVHAAAWVVPGKGIQLVRKMSVAATALDKAIGAVIRSKVDVASGYMLVTSRASYEMVQKCATVGISFPGGMAPTAFVAVRAGKEQRGLTLVAFARRDRHVVYANPERLT